MRIVTHLYQFLTDSQSIVTSLPKTLISGPLCLKNSPTTKGFLKSLSLDVIPNLLNQLNPFNVSPDFPLTTMQIVAAVTRDS